MHQTQKKVVIVTGIGGIGIACSRRIGAGYKLLLCDFDEEKLLAAAQDFTNSGYDVATKKIDVSNQNSIDEIVKLATELGEIKFIIHTAGISPSMGTTERILDVNLIGTARIIASFEPYIVAGTVAVFISSSSAYLGKPLTTDQQNDIRLLSATNLKEKICEWDVQTSNEAYIVSKRGNHVQVAVAATKWGAKGARIMSVSPGTISTPMSVSEQETATTINYMIENTPVGRIGTPEDIAAVVEFILGSNGSFLSGSDILVDGGITAFLHNA